MVLLSFASVGLLAAAPAAATVPTTAVALVERIEERHRSVTDLTARFTQTYRSGLLGRELVERGALSLKRPGRMLWQYEDPEKKTFVSDGESFYFYVPADRQVIVRDQAGEHSAPALLLAGKGRILDQFEASLEEAPKGRHRLLLTPREPDPEIERVYLEVDASYRIVRIEVFDAQGNHSRFLFEAIRENVGLPDKLFRFRIPAGVEVVSG